MSPRATHTAAILRLEGAVVLAFAVFSGLKDPTGFKDTHLQRV